MYTISLNSASLTFLMVQYTFYFNVPRSVLNRTVFLELSLIFKQKGEFAGLKSKLLWSSLKESFVTLQVLFVNVSFHIFAVFG